VMTVKQLKGDFSTFEAKRELAKRIDVVIGVKSIAKLLPSILGREFYKKKKIPLELELYDEYDWSNEFEKVLKKSVFNISLTGKTSTILVGHTNLNVTELTDNISKIVNWLMRLYPGGWKNVAQLSLHTHGVPPLMIYLGTATRKDDDPKAVTKGRKVTEPVVGDLSTLPGRKVKIHPYGGIDVTKDSDESEPEPMEDDGANSTAQKQKRKIVPDAAATEPAEPGREKKSPTSKETADMNSAERKYVETVFKRQEFEDLEEKKKRKSDSAADVKPKKAKLKSAKKGEKTKLSKKEHKR